MSNPTIGIERASHDLRRGAAVRVEDGPQTASWRFWDLWANGSWERGTFEWIDRLLPDGGAFLDVGAWVGPMTLWAAQRASVVALEPDPEAFRQLAGNVERNGLAARVQCINAAASLDTREVALWNVQGEWASSASSMTYEVGERVMVQAIDLGALIYGRHFDLIKMDIEGGEALLLPTVGPIIRYLKIPLLLSLHDGRYDPALRDALYAEVERWPSRESVDGRPESLLCRV